MRNKKIWVAGVAAMLLVIAFSSSSAAARLLDSSVDRFYAAVTGGKNDGRAPYMNFHFVIEKGAHLAMYFLLGLLLSGFYSNRRGRRWAYTVATGFAVGIASELLQFAFPGRDPSVRDALINFAGAILGALAFPLLFGEKRRPRNIIQLL